MQYSQEKWIPAIGEIVQHKTLGTIFRVERRTRVRDRKNKVVGIKIWDCQDGVEGLSFDLDEIQPTPWDIFVERFQMSVDGSLVTVHPVFEDDSSIVVAVTKGDRIDYVKIPNIKDQVIAAAVKLAKAFDGDRVEMTQEEMDECPF